MSNDKLAQALRRIKSNLMHQRRFGVDDMGHWRRAAAQAEGDLEEALATHETEKQAGPVAGEASAPALGERPRLLTMLPEARAALAALERIACNQTSQDHAEQFTHLREYLLSQQPATPPAPPSESDKAEPVAYTVAGEVTNWARDFSKYRTQHYVRPVYLHPSESDKEDAENYRWLANNCDGDAQDDFIQMIARNVLSRAEFDAAIRAARAKKEQP